MKHLVAFEGVIGLRHLGLSATEQVTGLRVVHLSQQLTTPNSLAFVYQYTLDDSHTGKTDGSSLALLYYTHIRLGTVSKSRRHDLRLHSDGSFLRFVFVLATTADSENR